ncbi:hypothetical protein HHI36_014810 [Cryptolaemus montrouzieri]|uniref:Uncharacterized protein n=1 Tax=Cryptolaemus montrouzieri TaxID=559131 RepID=A0ABD2N454_9CUCU
MSKDSLRGLPRVFGLLSPRSKSAINQINNKVDLNFLNNEIIALHSQASSDRDEALIAELNLLSQGLKENVEKNIQKTQASFKYSNTDNGPFTVIIESIQQNIGNLNPMNKGKMIYLDNYYKNIIYLKLIDGNKKSRHTIFYSRTSE